MAHAYMARSIGPLVEVGVKCVDCKEDQEFLVPTSEFEVYQSGTVNIQKAMPSVDAAKRELLVSGICGKCWDKMFKGEDD